MYTVFIFKCQLTIHNICIYIYIMIIIVGRVFANVPGPGFNPRSRHTKDFKMVLDTSLLNTKQNKVRIKGKVKQSRERSNTLPYTSVS